MWEGAAIHIRGGYYPVGDKTTAGVSVGRNDALSVIEQNVILRILEIKYGKCDIINTENERLSQIYKTKQN